MGHLISHRNQLKWILRTGLFAAGSATLPFVAGCDKPGQAAGAPPPIEVTYTTVKTETVPADYSFIGQTEASQSVEIRARVQGFLLDWQKNAEGKPNFLEGMEVEKGQLLFQIDPKEFEVAVEEANSNLDRATARDNRAQREVKRLTDAVASNAAALKELDDAVSEQLQSKADVRLQKATLEARKLDLSYTTIKSPIKGVIGRAQRDVGSLVDASSNSLLATVLQLDPTYVNFSFSERDYIQWRKDVEMGKIVMPAGGPDKLYIDITLIDGTPYPYWGEVNFADVRIDPQTGTASVRASIPNPLLISPQRKPDHLLKPGQFVKGKIVGWQRPNTISVPQKSIIQSAAGAYVYVIGGDNKPEVRPVKLGSWTGLEWIVMDGLAAGDRVIVDGALKVIPNVPVKPTALPPTVRPQVITKPSTAPAELKNQAELEQLRMPGTRPATQPATQPAPY
ncbi:efflux RND transporter periplasmic adaptor subunit [Humisphaera borealis]|uniref:Efflux RND transporter periplasmic adaptor subunit n=1 Tax=Humisphaera borealis TaxID=2807512 RepID=A0A7M2WVB9_9BACT|nr:efflux RND transporter periplasmic adaptor subunit [Humisphaera borealis]QOV89172.1 efflux RND transporter periplasmic adaptor subunit [Humisphaera borealis]